jgi:hypothetical protein
MAVFLQTASKLLGMQRRVTLSRASPGRFPGEGGGVVIAQKFAWKLLNRLTLELWVSLLNVNGTTDKCKFVPVIN